MTDFALITAIRDLIRIREDIAADSQRQKPLFTLEQRVAIVHVVNSYLDELLAPYTHGGKGE